MIHSWISRPLGIALSTASIGLLGCAGPLTHHGNIYMGRVVIAEPMADNYSPRGLPVKEARTYTAKQYVIEGTCTQADPTGCHVVETDLGQMVSAAPDHFLEIQYRGNIFISAELAIEINQNSTLRSLLIQDSGKDHSLYFHFGDQGTGVK